MLARLALAGVAIIAPLVAQAVQHDTPAPVVKVAVVVPALPAVAPAPYKYAAEIHENAKRFGVTPKLVVAVIKAESDFNPRAVSRTGARGLMQLMPDTAAKLNVADSFNPRENIRGGTQHLAYLLERYHGNVRLAVAAYNAGEGAVDRYNGIPPYEETVQYVRAVMAVYGSIRS